jgi:hypothetical protein
VPGLRYQDIKSAAYIDAIIHYAETLLGIRLKNVKKYRYSSPCPFHADTKDSLMVYVNKKDEVRFHCFGACTGDWDIYDVIMLRKKYRFRTAQQVWAEHLGVKDFKSMAATPVFLNLTIHRSPMIRLVLSNRRKLMKRLLPPWMMLPTSTMTF